LLDAIRDAGLEANTEKTKHMILFHHQTARQNNNLLNANKSFGNVTVQIFGKNSDKSKLHP